MEKFYVTTAIDYVNSDPHIGHAYQKIVADVLARWNKLKGREVFFSTGTDEHGKKALLAAQACGKPPKEYVDEISEKFKLAWKALNIDYDKFVRTTDEDHKKTVYEFIEKINKAGDIYRGKYKGWYCVGCEAYYTETELPDKICPIHKKPLELVEEDAYFFRLSKYQQFILDLYEKHPEFILPAERRNEMINKVKESLQDLCVTRTDFDWGIPFPLEQGYIVYIWFEALINYYTAINTEGKRKFWPPNVQLLGKDNAWFHTVIWPAMLKSAGIELPKTVFVHGFLTVNGEKISKSLGNGISPVLLARKYGADSVRYFCLKIPFSKNDGDFSEAELIRRHNTELADALGNLVNRVLVLVEKNFEGLVPNSNGGDGLRQQAIRTISETEKHVENFEFHDALSSIFFFVNELNKYVNDKKPWEMKDKTLLGTILYDLLESLRIISILLQPFLPSTSEKIFDQLGLEHKFSFEDLEWGGLKPGTKTKRGQVLFAKIKV